MKIFIAKCLVVVLAAWGIILPVAWLNRYAVYQSTITPWATICHDRWTGRVYYHQSRDDYWTRMNFNSPEPDLSAGKLKPIISESPGSRFNTNDEPVKKTFSFEEATEPVAK